MALDNEMRRHAISKWLQKRFVFTHFITLATNANDVPLLRMRKLIKDWDGRVNRKLYGPKWLLHHDELLFWFAFVEKPRANPHWHLLMRFPDTDKIDAMKREIEVVWNRLVPAGTVNIQDIKEKPERVAEYVAKQLGSDLQYNNFIAPDEFRRV
jgi:hypothetical protein